MISVHNGYQVIERNADFEAYYVTLKESRRISDEGVIPKTWGEAEKAEFMDGLAVCHEFLSSEFGNAIEPALVSSWVDGSGANESSAQSWKMIKFQQKTWGGRFPLKWKMSDYDFNLRAKRTEAPLDWSAMYFLNNGEEVATKAEGNLLIDIYPSKGERSVSLSAILEKNQ